MKYDEIDLQTIPFNIKESRERKGYSQTYVALYCNVSLAAYQRWENGVTKYIKKENYAKLAEILNK